MARLLKKPLIIALAAVILLVIGFFAYIQNAFTGTRGVEVCAACHGLAIDKMTALYGKRDDCSTCHPYHARPMHGKVYETRQATTKTVLE